MNMAPEDYWQELLPAGSVANPLDLPDTYVATLPDNRQLALPIRRRDDGTGLASLIVNQASFEVLDALAGHLADPLREKGVDLIVGLPTLGLTLAAEVARRMGHRRYLPLGTSPKFWYRPDLSVTIASVTTEAERRLYIDPRLLPLLSGRRIALVDDVISSGRSITAGLALLGKCGGLPVAIGTAMLQTDRWRACPCPALPGWQELVVGVLETPLLHRGEAGWRL